MTEQEIKALPYYRFVDDVFGVDKIQNEHNVFTKAFKRNENTASLSFDVTRGVCYDFGGGGCEKTCEDILCTLFDITFAEARAEVNAMLQGFNYLRPIPESIVAAYVANIHPEAQTDGRKRRPAEERLSELQKERALSEAVWCRLCRACRYGAQREVYHTNSKRIRARSRYKISYDACREIQRSKIASLQRAEIPRGGTV